MPPNKPSSRPHLFVRLTEADQAGGKQTAPINVFELIAYKGEPDHTELTLVGGQIIRVLESTDEVDRIVREAFEKSAWAGSSRPPILPQ